MEYIKTYLKEKREILKYIITVTFIWSMLGHAFAYFNLVPQTDAMVYSTRLAGEWEISLGRFIIPLYDKLRGTLLVPWFTGVCTTLFIAVSVWCICEILEYKDKVVIALIAGFLSVNVSITEVNANFGYATDQYAFAIMLALIGAMCLIKGKSWKTIIACVLLFTVSLGIYQSEIIVAAMVILFWVVSGAMNNREVKKTFSVCGRCMAGYAVSAGCYYVLYKAILKVTDVDAAGSYNSITSMGKVTAESIWFNLVENLKCLYKLYFTKETITGNYARVGNTVLFAGVFVLCVYFFCKKRKDISLVNKFIAIVGILVTPVVSIIVPVMMSEFMPRLYVNYSIFVLYVWVIVIWQTAKVAVSTGKQRTIETIVAFSSGLILLSNILFSNNLYSYEKMMYDRSLSITTQIVYELNHMEGYKPGETPVVLIIDDLITNDNITQIKFDRRWLANSKKMNFTYTASFSSFIDVLGENVNFVSAGEYLSEEEKTVVETMPIYPANGYIEQFDNAIVIKFCELLYW